MKIPKSIRHLTDAFEKLPGIGPKTAQRLTFYLLHVPQHELDNFADYIKGLKSGIKICSICKNIGEQDPCEICADGTRDKSTVCVVETPLDVIAIEKTAYKGRYHVLHGLINPLQNIGPDEIYIKELIERLKNSKDIKEVIIATNPTMEGETTFFYITRLIKKLSKPIRITRIGRGLPTGADLEYADEITLKRALEGRTEVE